MITYAQRRSTRCVLMEPEDWRDFRDMRLALETKKIEETGCESRLLDAWHRRTDDEWIAQLSETRFPQFVVLQRVRGSDLAVATGAIALPFIDDSCYREEAPQFIGDYVPKEQGGQGLTALLHEARINFVARHTHYDSVEIDIPAERDEAFETMMDMGFVGCGHSANGTEVHTWAFRREIRDYRTAETALEVSPLGP